MNIKSALLILFLVHISVEEAYATCRENTNINYYTKTCSVHTVINFNAAVNKNTAVLSWGAHAIEPIQGFIVRRHEDYDLIRRFNGQTTTIEANPVAAGSYTTVLNASGSYTFCSTARGISGNHPSFTQDYKEVCRSVYFIMKPASISYPAFNASGSFTVDWASPAGATRNQLYRRTGTGSWSLVYEGGATRYSQSGLSTGEYQYRVRGCKDSICSEFREGNSVKVELTPGQPASITVPAYSSSSNSSVNWSSVSWSSNSTKRHYELDERVYNGSNWSSWSKIYDDTGTSVNLSNLVHSYQYQYRVRACNSTCSSYSMSNTLSIVYQPAIPTLSISPMISDDGQYEASWNEVNYAVNYELSDNAGTRQYYGTALSKDFISDNGLYSYRVRACNSQGTCSNYSAYSSVTVDRDVSVPTLSIDSTNSALGQVSINWTEVIKGSLTVEYELVDGTGAVLYSGPNLSFTVQNLVDGNYCFKVRARTVSDVSDFSLTNCVDVQNLLAPDSAPVLNAPASTDSSYNIHWSTMENVDRFELQQSINNSTWETVQLSDNTQFTYNPDLIVFGTHRYRIRAGNTAGWSDYGTETPVVVELDPTAQIRKQLYYNEADDIPAAEENPSQGQFSREKAAFRYMDLMYVVDPNSNKVINRFASGDSTVDFSTLYSESERNRARTVEDFISEQLALYPDNTNLQRFLLDVYYDRAVAEMILANVKLDKARVSRLRSEDILTETVYIDDAFTLLSSALEQYESLLVFYPNFLVNYAASRGQISPRYRDANDVAQNVVDEDRLFTGYKDIVMQYQLMIKMAETKVKQARLLIVAGQTNQTLLDTMKDELIDLKVSLLEKEKTLTDLFPSVDFTLVEGLSGLSAAVYKLDSELRELDQAVSWMAGDSNIVGLPKDAVLLVQGYGLDGNTTFDSFDAMKKHLDPDSSGPLQLAVSSEIKAQNSLDTFRYNRDKLATEYTDRNQQLNNWLYDLLGMNCDGVLCESQGEEARSGSQISLQQANINSAQIALDRNILRLENLLSAIEIEIDRRAAEEQIENGREQVILTYGDKQAKIVDQIKEVRKKAAESNRIAGAITTVVSTAVTVISAGVATPLAVAAVAASTASSISVSNAEIRAINSEGKLQRLSQQLAAEERAKLVSLNNQLLDVQSEAKISTMWLEANTIALDIAQTEITVEQEIERLQGLINQVERVITQIYNTNADLVDRYFADPIHGSRLSNDTIQAERYFELAQQWLFYAVNALEYKWQEDFRAPLTGETKDAVYTLRNTDELKQFYAEMVEFDKLRNFSNTRQASDTFSIKEHVFGYVDQIDGQVQMYSHPDPDQDVGQRLSADEAFREQIKLLTRSFGDDDWVTFEFSSVKELPRSNFFVGPVVASSEDMTCLADGGTYLDKIETVKLNIPIEYNVSGDASVPAYLTYGGTSYLRHKIPGSLTEDGLGIENEFITHSIRFWDVADGNTLAFKDSYREQMTANLSVQGDVGTGSITTAFSERSVAASGWRLSVKLADRWGRLVDVDAINDVELIINHRYKSRNFDNCDGSPGGPLFHDE